MGRVARWLAVAFIVLLLIVGALMAALESAWATRKLAEAGSRALERELTIGDLDIDWSLHPQVRLRDVRLANADWAQPERMAEGSASARIDLARMFGGTLAITELRLEQPRLHLRRAGDGASNWDIFVQPDGPKGGGLPLRVELGALRVVDGRLSYQDARERSHGKFALETAAEGEPGLRLQGEGERGGQPFRLRLTGAPPLQLSSDRPFPFSLDLVSEDTRIHAKGSLMRPLSLAGADVDLRVEGPDMEVLHALLSLPTPSLPPYRLSGHLRYREHTVSLSGIDGRVGDSDLAGELTVELGGERPFLRADLRSRRLDFDDLLPTVGAPPAAGPGETASAAQARRAERREESTRVLPEARADRERFQALNARIRFRGERVNAPKLPLDRVTAEISLQDGVLRFEPLGLHIGDGAVDATVSLDARQAPIQGAATLKLRRVPIDRLLPDLPVSDDNVGVLGGQGKFGFTGLTVADALASLTGTMQMLMTGGKLDALLVELAGLDAGEALVAALARSDAVDIECAFIDLKVDQGRAAFEQMVLATSDTDFTADGWLDFGKERLKLTIEPKPRDTSIVSASSPVTVSGRFNELEVDVAKGELIGRGVAAAAAALIAPPLALLPLIERGSGKESNAACRKVLGGGGDGKSAG